MEHITRTGRGYKQSFAIDRRLIDGSLRSPEVEHFFPDMTEAHWGYLIYMYSCLKSTNAIVFPGPNAAITHSAFFFNDGLTSRERNMALYGPILEYGFARRAEDKYERGMMVNHYELLGAPTPTPDGYLIPGSPFVLRTAKANGIPFVTLPQGLMRGAWAFLDDAERQCLCAVYAYLAADTGACDPRHLRLENGQVVASRAFLRAGGVTGAKLLDVLASLERKQLISMKSAFLGDAPLFPGSRPPAVLLKTGERPSHLIVPVLQVPSKSKRRAS